MEDDPIGLRSKDVCDVSPGDNLSLPEIRSISGVGKPQGTMVVVGAHFSFYYYSGLVVELPS